jgi:hypothetical protein
MSDAMYDLIYIMESLTNVGFKFYFLWLIYKYIELRRYKA